MSSYAEDMRQFRMNTPVSEALDHLPRNSDTPAGYSRLTLKLDVDVHTATLEDVDTYRKRFASEFLLSQLALSLFDLQESSLLVTWLVPAAVGAMISDQVHKTTASFFLSNGILKLSLEGECLYPMVTCSQSDTRESSSPAIEAGASFTPLVPHQNEMKGIIDLGPNHRGLAIVVPYFDSLLNITNILRETLRFTVYEPQDKPSLNSYMQAVDLELKHHPIIVVVDGHGGRGNLLRTDIGVIDIKEDIMAPLFPPIGTHLADNPKIFLFIGSSECLSFVEVDTIWDNCIFCFITCNDEIRMTDIVHEELVSPSMSVQEIFTSISDILQPAATITVINHLKEPVYLYPDGSDRLAYFDLSSFVSLPPLHRRLLQESSEESDSESHLLEQSIDVTGLEPDTERLQVQPIKKADTELLLNSSTSKCIII
ncbi:uncharacterized protein LOC135340537 isoform X2 [Halichondria panicea]|uniref:uncharacterized protein LOC135340537 isoform X2 n=1 Tax=Halichondria panicea TaxID=6063 RepID=UPI00312BA7C8